MVTRPADGIKLRNTLQANFQSPGSMALQVRQARDAMAAQKAPEHMQRLSSLAAPIMLLMGHEGEIYTAKFHPDGQCLASAGFEHKIFFWDVYGECQNFAVLKGHAGAVMEINFSTDGGILVSCSTDKTVRAWDVESGAALRRFRGHAAFVNSASPSRRGHQLVASASDDGTARVWDLRAKEPTHTFNNTYQLTATTFSDTAEVVFTGGIDNEIKAWDLRTNRQITEMVFRGHSDTVTGLSLSPDGTHLLSNAMDGTLRAWDVRPFGPANRCIKVFDGHQHNFEKNLLRAAWSPDGHRVTAGSADRYVYVWDVATRRVVYKLPGHQGSVNETAFHPKEPILLSAASDKKIYLGEIE